MTIQPTHEQLTLVNENIVEKMMKVIKTDAILLKEFITNDLFQVIMTENYVFVYVGKYELKCKKNDAYLIKVSDEDFNLLFKYKFGYDTDENKNIVEIIEKIEWDN